MYEVDMLLLKWNFKVWFYKNSVWF